MPQLERYRLEELLGAGGMALVYRGYDAELARPVAVKLLADNLAGDLSFRQRFLREARAAARLSHPNVVQIYDVGELAGRPYFVMEYVAGETVAQYLERRGRLPIAKLLEIALAVGAGLEHAHAHGVVHRDIKPQNLLLPADGGVKIVDFGISRTLDGTAITEIGTLLGTAAYAAPEQVAGLPVTAAADIYALGVVLFELASGASPFGGATLTQALLARKRPALPSLLETAGATPALDRVVSRCLSVTSESRPTARELQRELADIADELGTAEPASDEVADPPRAPADLQATFVKTRVREAHGTEPGPTGPDRKRLPAIVVVIAAAVLLALAGLVALQFRGRGATPPVPPGQAKPPQRASITPTGGSPTAQAKALSAWLRANAR